MNPSFRSLAAGLAAAFAMGAAAAAPRGVEPFGPKTWAALQSALQRPTAVVFTTTDCTHCPAAIARIADAIAPLGPRAGLAAVVMDLAPGEADAALLANPHYARADRLLAFAAAAPALRFEVSPRWRGVTPFVALLVPGRAPLFVTGAPSPAQLDAWLGEAGLRAH